MSMAIKYAMQKKRHKGVHAGSNEKSGESPTGDLVRSAGEAGHKADLMDDAKLEHMEKLSELKSMRGQDRAYLADGGNVSEEQKKAAGSIKNAFGYKEAAPAPSAAPSKPAEDWFEGGSHSHKKAKGISDSFSEFAEGGEVGKPCHMCHGSGYSKGGEVANDDEPLVDSMPNEFDDLVLDDDLEMHETGKNSGDEIGDKQEDEDRRDVVSSIMKSRKKKDKMPHPA